VLMTERAIRVAVWVSVVQLGIFALLAARRTELAWWKQYLGFDTASPGFRHGAYACVVRRIRGGFAPGGLTSMNGLYAVKPWYTRRLRRFVDLAVARRISPD